MVRGSTSSYVTKEHRLALGARFPQHEVVTLEGAGHFLHTQDPRGLLKSVDSFVSEHICPRA